MRIYFSGGRGLKVTPETLIAERKPHIMLTYHDMDSNGSIDRFNVYLKRKGFPLLPRTGKKKEYEDDGTPHHTQSMFMDSGAYTLYNLYVRKAKPLLGKNGKELERPKHYRVTEADFVNYTLKKGTDFRRYCDDYARFIKRYVDSGMLFTNVDVIGNPERTWQVQQFFEQEHGITPVPVVHATGKTPVDWAIRYVETGNYKLLGVGGLGQNVGIKDYLRWATTLYKELCPASNKHLPVIRTHGFAMTSWKLIREYPWWSVDSATWIKLAAYGWLYVPRRSSRTGEWDYEIPPFQINVSIDSPQDEHGRHFRNLSKERQRMVTEWLEHWGLDLGSVEMTRRPRARGMDVAGNPIAEEDFAEDSVSGHFVYRAVANLHYLKGLEESRPKWPSPYNPPKEFHNRRLFSSALLNTFNKKPTHENR